MDSMLHYTMVHAMENSPRPKYTNNTYIITRLFVKAKRRPVAGAYAYIATLYGQTIIIVT